uniref:Uncharacterized protein n=1 Tax=Macaca fascicularis TaxID=9541 RepID=Q9N017_MACFA|nr:hypothetical protein [Macaca fascicularis]
MSRGRFYRSLCYTDKEMEVQTGSVSCSRSHSWQVSELAANLGLTVNPQHVQPLWCYSAKHPQTQWLVTTIILLSLMVYEDQELGKDLLHGSGP